MSGSVSASVGDQTDCSEKAEEVYDLIRTIRDPEKDATLEQLAVVREQDVHVSRLAEHCDRNDAAATNHPSGAIYLVRVGLTPTVSHCSLATLIGLCVRVRLEENLYFRHKLDVHLKPDSHDTADQVNKQINDKERVAAAMENPALSGNVRNCIRDAE